MDEFNELHMKASVRAIKKSVGINRPANLDGRLVYILLFWIAFRDTWRISTNINTIRAIFVLINLYLIQAESTRFAHFEMFKHLLHTFRVG